MGQKGISHHLSEVLRERSWCPMYLGYFYFLFVNQKQKYQKEKNEKNEAKKCIVVCPTVTRLKTPNFDHFLTFS